MTPPFLSVVTRTQGRRPHTLGETLAALAAQTDPDLELLLIAHKVAPPGLEDLAQILAALPEPLRGRSRLIPLDNGNRTAPLNLGLDMARGDYLAVVDDDDLVLPHWAATFRAMAAASPGQVLRAACRVQPVSEIRDGDTPRLEIVGELEARFPDEFDFLGHLAGNQTAPVALAWPRRAMLAAGLRFDDSLSTTEDWDLLMRCAGQLGIATTSEVTSIYRWWEVGESSRTAHDLAEWRANNHRIAEKWNAAPLVLPPGSLYAVRELVACRDALATARAELAALRAEVVRLSQPSPAGRRERSWRQAAPLRWLAAALSRP